MLFDPLSYFLLLTLFLGMGYCVSPRGGTGREGKERKGHNGLGQKVDTEGPCVVGRNERGTSGRVGQGGTSGKEGHDGTIGRQKGVGNEGQEEQVEHRRGGGLPRMNKGNIPS